MTEITLKFLSHLARANTEDRKTRTIRRTPHGKPGDIFFCQGIAYIITRIDREPLCEALRHYSDEGYASRPEFLDDLVKIYCEVPLIGDIFYVHHYQKCGHINLYDIAPIPPVFWYPEEVTL
ncbi:MAG: hypothetical protein O0X96_05655 [Methanocorpusculum sp.]|nr:hypothetical protein [Methanocorpusculum sp.]MDE2524596.1 hypothetical protein [Methanocorpusculum sp.]